MTALLEADNIDPPSMRTILKKIFGILGYSIRRNNTEVDLVYWAEDKAFEQAYRETSPYSMLSLDRSFMIWQFAKQSRTLQGDAAELGVYKGGSAKLIVKALKGSGKTVHLFDTFNGMPDVNPSIDLHKKKDFQDTSLESVKKIFDYGDKVIFYSGIFPDTASNLKNKKFAFIYLDADIYSSTKSGLEFFYQRLVPGGFIILDDFRGKSTPGVEKALDEFLVGKSEIPIITALGQCLLIKANN